MVRKQIYLRKDQDAALKRQAAKLGVSEAELIRRKLEQPARSGVSRPTRPEAWNDVFRYIRERASRLPDLKQERTWTREDLYEDRLGRLSNRH
jgi:CO/xanthine dehydrogenase Mo-binding subunit